jgi:PD-(D/E)XK nuclease superfamily
VQEEKPSTSFTFAASVTAPDVKRIANLFPSRILCFLRFLLFQDETNNMHPNFAKADRLSGEIIGAAIEVHRIMGPGLLESIYERCLLRELELRGIPVLNQEEVVIDYKGTVFKEKRNLKASPACCKQDLNNQDFEQKATKETKGKSPAEFGGCTKHERSGWSRQWPTALAPRAGYRIRLKTSPEFFVSFVTFCSK